MKGESHPSGNSFPSVGEFLPTEVLDFAKRYSAAFFHATGFELQWICSDGQGIFPFAEGMRNPFCRKCFSQIHLRENCLHDLKRLLVLANGAPGRFAKMRCHAGLSLAVLETVRLPRGIVYLLAGRLPVGQKGRPNGIQAKRLSEFNAALEMLFLSLPWIREQIQWAELFGQPNGNKMVERALQYVRNRFTEPISLGEVARHCGVSLSYLSHHFKETTGIAFPAFLTRLRLDRAERLLAETTMRITEICFAAGFQSVSRFSRCFKGRYALSPRNWRDKHARKMVLRA